MCVTCNDGTLSVAIQQLSKEIFEINVEKGWEPDKKRTVGDEVALLHSEVSEIFEAYREWGFDDATADPEPNSLPKPEGMGSEYADLFIRILHYTTVHGIDLIQETRRKIEYNKTRSFRHGGKNL